jgi:hypothetical protein
LGRLGGGCGVDSPGSGQGSLTGSRECGDEPSGSGATELVQVSSKQPAITVQPCSIYCQHWIGSCCAKLLRAPDHTVLATVRLQFRRYCTCVKYELLAWPRVS